jgi:hypothetical protein
MPSIPRRPDHHGPAVGSVDSRQLEKSVSWSGHERLRYYWYRLRLTVADMNYATRRVAELQAPPGACDRPSRGHPGRSRVSSW